MKVTGSLSWDLQRSPQVETTGVGAVCAPSLGARCTAVSHGGEQWTCVVWFNLQDNSVKYV